MSSHVVHDDSKTLFGFWIYLLSDFVLFGALFATYAVLKNNTCGGASGAELLDPEQGFIPTLCLLIASGTSGWGKVAASRDDRHGVMIAYSLTLLFGILFFLVNLIQWSDLVRAGHSWKESAFLSAYFTLVGTFALHLFFALLWIPVTLVPLCCQKITQTMRRRISCLTLFWQFLSVVWIFIYAIVYLLGGNT